jgi:uncharacterized protein YdiU (UPF0061 family)
LEFVSVNALYPLIQEAAPLESILERYQTQYQQAYLEMMQNKLFFFKKKQPIHMLTENLQLTETDMTIFSGN